MEPTVADPYADWLAIPAHLRPPTYYQLLGIDPSELDPTAIAAAAERQLERLRPHETASDGEACRRIQREIVDARDTLLDPVARQRYDTLTPDAPEPWWKPEPDAHAQVSPEPVQGWWQGESPEVDRAPGPVASSAVAAAPPTPLTRDVAPAPVRPSVPPPRADDWWRAAPGEAPAIEPATSPAAAPPVPAPTPAPPPVPVRTPPAPASVPVPAPAPVIREQALTFAPPDRRPSVMLWAVSALLGVGALVGAVLYVTKPWRSAEPSPDNKQVAELKPKQEVVPPVVPPGKDPPSATSSRTTDPGTPKRDPDDPPAPPPKKDPGPADPVAFTEAMTFTGHVGSVYGVAVSRSARTILSVSDDRGVLHYSPDEKGKHGQLHKLQSPGVAVALCNDDRDAVFCDGGEVIVYDLGARKVRATFENPRGGIRSLAPARDGSFVLTGTTDGCVRWWSPSTKGLVHTLDLDPKATVTAVAVAPDARAATFGLSDGRICAWDLKERREVKRWKAHAGAVTAAAYAPDGQRVVSAGEDGVANVWQAGAGKLVQKLAGHEGPVLGAAWCSDGKRVATAGIDRRVRLWDQDRGWKADWSPMLDDRAFSLAIDSKDRFVLVGLASGAVKLLPLPAARPGDTPGH
jgi:WD domain, G-beta repeat